MSGLIGRRAVLAGGGAALITGLCGRSAAADTLSRGDLAEDVAIVRQALALHPGLYRYARPATVPARLEAFGAAFGAAARPKNAICCSPAFSRPSAAGTAMRTSTTRRRRLPPSCSNGLPACRFVSLGSARRWW